MKKKGFKSKHKNRGFKLSSFAVITPLILVIVLLGTLLFNITPLSLSPSRNSFKNVPVKLTNKNNEEAASTRLEVQISGRSVKVPILTYHYVGENPNPADLARNNLSVSPKEFEDQMNYLSINGYSPITLDTLYAGLEGKITLPAKPVVLTFDDGYIDFYINAFPILRRFNFHAVSFIPTGLMNQGYYLSWDQIREMDNSGLIIFQPHSVTHTNLSSLNEAQIIYQIRESKKVLENNLGKPVNFFAYPYGIGGNDYRVIKALKDSGFIGAVSTIYGNIESEGNIYNLPRFKIPGGLILENFGKLL